MEIIKIIKNLMAAKKSVKKAVKEEVVETTAEAPAQTMCSYCYGKGTIMEGHKICPACNGNCFA